MDYRVELDVYNGPLDLLLYLIKRDELDIYDIPIARITDTYMAYVDCLKAPRKTRLGYQRRRRVPGHGRHPDGNQVRHAPPQAAGGPGQHIRRGRTDRSPHGTGQAASGIQEVQRRRRTAGQRQQDQEQRFTHAYPSAKGETAADEPPPVDLDEVQVWISSARLRAITCRDGNSPRRTSTKSIHDQTRQSICTPRTLRISTPPEALNLTRPDIGRSNRSEMIGIFLALLELIRQKKIQVHQAEVDGDMEIEPAPKRG